MVQRTFFVGIKHWWWGSDILNSVYLQDIRSLFSGKKTRLSRGKICINNSTENCDLCKSQYKILQSHWKYVFRLSGQVILNFQFRLVTDLSYRYFILDFDFSHVNLVLQQSQFVFLCVCVCLQLQIYFKFLILFNVKISLHGCFYWSDL